MEASFPSVLYKYRSFQETEKISDAEKFQKKSLTENEIFFSHPKLFNDPFDLNFRKNYDEYEDELVFQGIYHLSRNKDHVHKSFAELEGLARKTIDENKQKNPDYYQNLAMDELRDFRDRHGVFCLSEKCDDILMWAHYGNSNKGFCIGYDSNVLFNYLLERYQDKLQIISKVIYSDLYPNFFPSFSEERKKDMLIDRLITKSTVWEYEKEWRLVTLSFVNESIKLPNSCISEIVLGSNIQPEVAEEIKKIKLKKYPDSKLLQIEPDKSSFFLKVRNH